MNAFVPAECSQGLQSIQLVISAAPLPVQRHPPAGHPRAYLGGEARRTGSGSGRWSERRATREPSRPGAHRRWRPSPPAVFRRTGPSTSSQSDPTIHGSLQPGLERVADQPRHQPPQRDMLLLGDPAQVVQEVVGQGHPDLRIGAPCSNGVAAAVRCSLMRSAGVHDRRSLSMAGGVGARAFDILSP